MRREERLCLCSAVSVDILTATTLCRLCFCHADPSPVTQISRLVVKSKQIKEFRCCRSTLGSGIRVAFPSSSKWDADDRDDAMSMILIFTGEWNRPTRNSRTALQANVIVPPPRGQARPGGLIKLSH